MKKLGFFLLLGLAGFKAPGLFAEDPPFHVEGIVYEDAAPETSTAVIEGQFLKKGGRWQSFEIVEVRRNEVVVSDASGKQITVPVTGPAPKAPAPPSPAPSQKVPPSPLDKLKDQLSNPLGIFNMAHETAAKADLRNLHTQAAAYYAEQNTVPGLSTLAELGLVDPAFKEVKGKYRFEIKAGKNGPEVYADPADPKSGLRYLMIDEWGKLLSEKGKRASAKSSDDQNPFEKSLKEAGL